MRDLKLYEIYGHTLRIAKPPFESPGCLNALNVYLSNVNRAYGVLEAAVFAAYTAGTKEGYRALFYQREFGTFKPTDEQISGSLQKFSLELNGILATISTEKQNERINVYAAELDFYIRNSPENVQMVFEEVLKSILIQNWTATEVLLGDLWEAAVNECPEELAFPPQKNPKDPEKVVSVKSLSKYGFNPSEKMGSLLKETMNFQTLDGARNAYRRTFWKHEKPIHRAILDSSLTRLSLVRNIIVHRAGIIDEMFLKGAKDVPLLAPISAPGAGRHIDLDGEMVQNLLEISTGRCLDLILAVGSWLDKHRPTK